MRPTIIGESQPDLMATSSGFSTTGPHEDFTVIWKVTDIMSHVTRGHPRASRFESLPPVVSGPGYQRGDSLHLLQDRLLGAQDVRDTIQRGRPGEKAKAPRPRHVHVKH